ncbi:hypothetical protein KZZ52_25240 [Dactylosporangium sp. AC04546]|uniref:hypothetical protein n=1 Tax=Dactylosporangium sp. AC04546 TaxID=2862460 RepID=UPI001EE074D5|nr:hypothetical protein [Dactylosporangium sp. AC04546]WVK88576.1 hypothetical protein KZZ52_25240 [Dactylosporangium sp. AC04546]
MRRAFGRWAVAAVAIPLAVAGARKVSERIEARRGSTRASRLLRQGTTLAERLTGR